MWEQPSTKCCTLSGVTMVSTLVHEPQPAIGSWGMGGVRKTFTWGGRVGVGWLAAPCGVSEPRWGEEGICMVAAMGLHTEELIRYVNMLRIMRADFSLEK